MNLTVDVGNTNLKLSVIKDSALVESFFLSKDSLESVESVFERYPELSAAIMLSSGERISSLESLIEARVERFVFFDSKTPVPLKNLYLSPTTLGSDRMAAAVGASELFRGQNVMIVDFGTAITVDLVSEKAEYLGGNISLGLKSQYRALNDYTFSLPLCSATKDLESPARSTQQAIESGVMLSVIYQIEGYVRDYSERFENLKIVFAGGDAELLSTCVRADVVVEKELVSKGLNRILEYNAD